jgi:small-conductance mechanosensitive channel/CRP-like cAMP-binding protein
MPIQVTFVSCWIAVLVVSLLLWRPGRAMVRPVWVQLALSAGCWWFAFDEVARAFLEVAAILSAVALLTAPLMGRLRLPRFLADLVGLLGVAAVLVTLLSRLGVNVTGLIATSAVATAVLGFALQDLLQNLAGGVALELEEEIVPGAWIKTDLGLGKVNHVRLRHTSITTADGDTILIPNSSLTKSPVTLVPMKRRHLVKFVLGYGRDPARVMEAVGAGLAASPIAGVTMDPAPRCMVVTCGPDFIEYGVHIWLTQPGTEYGTYSAILTRIYYALSRSGASMAPIAQVLDLHSARRPDVGPDFVAALRQIPLFRALTDSEVDRVAPRMKMLSFGVGEMILRQGDEGDSMYLMLTGKANVSLQVEGGLSQQVAVLWSGDFFGEMSLLTGEKRSATVEAAAQVDCLWLEKADLIDLLSGRPEIAEDMSLVMAERQVELAGIREKLDKEGASRRVQSARELLLRQIRGFFGLGSSL